MLFYEEVKDTSNGSNAGGVVGSKGGLAPPLVRVGGGGDSGVPTSPISPLPESGDKLTQLQVATPYQIHT